MDPTLADSFHSFDGPIFFPRLFGPMIAVALIYGVTLPIFAFLAWVYSARGLKSRAARLTALASIFCFILWTGYLIISVQHSYLGFGFLGEIAAFGDYVAAAGHNDRQLFPRDLTVSWLQNLIFIISDVIVLWRALILFPGRRWIVYLLLSFWVVNLGLSTAALALTSTFDKYILIWDGELPIQPRLNNAFNYVSLGLNIISTILIGWRLWMHVSLNRLADDKSSGALTRGSGRILALLVEAGALLSCFMLVNVVISQVVPDNPAGTSLVAPFAKEVFGSMTIGLFAVYPSLITVLSYYQKSVVESAEQRTMVASQ